MTPILSKSEAAAIVVAARLRKGLTWAEIATELDRPLVWTVSALLGQHPVPAEVAEAACTLLDLDEVVAESLRQ